MKEEIEKLIEQYEFTVKKLRVHKSKNKRGDEYFTYWKEINFWSKVISDLKKVLKKLD